MNTKKILENIEPREAVRSFVFPVKKTRQGQDKSELDEARKKLRSTMSDKDRLIAELLQFKFQLEDYINSDAYDPKKTFGKFLLNYLSVIGKKSSEFAKDINVHKTEISHIINGSRSPNDRFIVRLELHSNSSIPAEHWRKLSQKYEVYQLKNNRSLRASEKRKIKSKIPVRL